MLDTAVENAELESQFSYQPLEEPDSIRLLHLHPASSSTAEVRCDIIHTTLTICADIYNHYTALSYVWGDANSTRTIWVDGVAFSITVNLFSALRDLRDERRALRVWADAICINQRDEEEKSAQIAFMGTIYSLADYTVIYLGPNDANWNNWVSSNFDESRFSFELTDSILSQPWFQRVWVFQELVFSRDPRVQLGRYRIPWDTLHRILTQRTESGYTATNSAAIQGFKLLSEMHQARQRHQRTANVSSSKTLLSQLLRISTAQGSGSSMLDLLRARRGLGVTDPKDMIFAHLGIASDGQDLNQKIKYSMSFAEVYHSFACHLIDKGLHFELFQVLSEVDPSVELHGLPTWVPDWRVPEMPLPKPVAFQQTFREPPYGFYEPDLRVSPRFRDINTFHDPPILACPGVEVDVVLYCSGSLYKVEELYDRHSEILLQYAAVRSSPNHSFDAFQRAYMNVYDLIWRTTIMDDNILPPLDVEFLFQEWRHFYKECIGSKTFIQEFSDPHPLDTVLAYLMDTYYYIESRWSISEHRLARLSSGRLAIVPLLTRRGDTVTFLRQPPTSYIEMPLFVLHPLDVQERTLEFLLREKYSRLEIPILGCQLVGPCFIEGLRVELTPNEFPFQKEALYLLSQRKCTPLQIHLPTQKLLAIH